MAFPATQAPVVVEIAPGADLTNRGIWVWQDITSDVRVADGIVIEGGRRDEGEQADTTICHLTLNNRNGNYSPRNAQGTWYGDLSRNTPMRVRWTVDRDLFTTPVAGSWGTTPGGYAWTTFGSGGTVDAADFEVIGGEGVHYVEAANAFRGTYLAGVTMLDGEIQVTSRTALVAAPTGAGIEHAGVMFRVQDSLNYYMAGVVTETSGSQFVRVWKVVAGVRTQLASSGIIEVFPADLPQKVKVQVVGAEINVKTWEASGTEPIDWDITWPDYTFPAAGGVGVRSGVTTGNTNTKPVAFFYDNFTVTSDRFVGYVSEWPTRWDMSGNESWVPIEACGVLRRLEQGTAPLQSPLRRRIPRLSSSPIAYWPLEDREGSGQGGSAVSGVAPLEVTGFTFGADSECAGSAPNPTTTVGSSYSGLVPVGGNNQWCVSFMYKITPTVTNTVIQIRTTGTIRRWHIRLRVADVNVLGYDADDTLQINATGGLVAGTYGEWNSLHLSVYGSGASDIAYQLRWNRGGGSTDTGNLINTTFASASPGEVTRVYLNPRGAGADELSLGHLSVWDTALLGGTAYSSSAMGGHANENAAIRLSRLCGENSIPFATQLDSAEDTSAAMGPQPIANLVDALRECEAADGGILYEVDGGLSYMDRAARYNPPVWMAIDQDSSELASTPEPADDDLQLFNDVTVSRVGGSSARAVNQGSIDTQGVYDTSVELNLYQDSQLADMAAWLVHLGSVDEMRWPRLALNLVRSPSLIPGWMSYRPGARLTVAHTITQLPGVDIDVLAEGWTEVIEPFNYRVELNCVPASPWIVGSLDGGDRLDTSGSSLASGVTSTATSLSVSTPSGPLWTTDVAEFPFDVKVTGERMTVTAISGASSPQTWTVTRSVNGVVKAHTSGADVRLYRPIILAM